MKFILHTKTSNKLYVKVHRFVNPNKSDFNRSDLDVTLSVTFDVKRPIKTVNR